MNAMSELVESDAVHGYLHRPDGDAVAALAFTHGAGGNVESRLLVALADELSTRGVAVLRYTLPYRRRREAGPPQPSRAAEDREGIAAAIEALRSLVPNCPILAGGQSYGGRQTSMLLAENTSLVDGLVLTSYPLHPPGKPEKLRTEHLPQLIVPTIIVHGSKDTFATTGEITAACALIPASTTLVEIDKGRHDLSPDKFAVVTPTADAVEQLIMQVTANRGNR
ncbi:MAG: alpha/beta hydrolase [Rhodococcus sp.]|nr:alpha/beta hydrolase [Rhodococcus sp. (in: high G+C Gram-positive bacteria)]